MTFSSQNHHSALYYPLSIPLGVALLVTAEQTHVLMPKRGGDVMGTLKKIVTHKPTAHKKAYLTDEETLQDQIQQQLEAKLSLLAKQIAHNIRSPLSALQMTTKHLDTVIPQREKRVIENAIQQIDDAANSLLTQYQVKLDHHFDSESPSNLTIQDEEEEETPDVILIEDNLSIRLAWEINAEKKNKQIKTFEQTADFEDIKHTINKDTLMYIDSCLGEDIKGEAYAERLFNEGFTNIHLCTGHETSRFPKMPWIKEIRDKTPPF